MAHWSDGYIGREYVLGEADCARLCADVRSNVFGLPVPDAAEVERAASRRRRNNQIAAGVADLAYPTDAPVDGDVVLMVCRGRPSHVGVFCIVDSEPSVLHAMENARMVVRHRLRDLDRVQLKVEGFYKWK